MSNNQSNRSHDMTAEEQYHLAETLARKADKNGGPLPVQLLRESAMKGYAPALYALANWHIHGKGVRKNLKKAVELLKAAAAQKNPDAEYDLAFCYEVGEGGLAKDPTMAPFWYRRASTHGDIQSMTELGRCYYYGIGIKRSLVRSLAWHSKAALLGNTESQYVVGRAFELGEGRRKNLKSAFHWYRLAAEGGEKDAKKAIKELDLEH